MLPNIKAGVMVGVFKTKGATAEKTNEQPMEEWFATVHGLPAAWPHLSMIGSDNMKKVRSRPTGYSSPLSGSQHVGTISPNWGLLHRHLMPLVITRWRKEKTGFSTTDPTGLGMT